jgi:hypothetical protein
MMFLQNILVQGFWNVDKALVSNKPLLQDHGDKGVGKCGSATTSEGEAARN